MREETLSGGNASGAVVRIGNTVRKSWTDATGSVVEFVVALRAQGVDAPAPLGRDEQGRQIIEFVPGTLAIGAPPFSTADLRRVGAMIREIHDASAAYLPGKTAIWQTAIPSPGNDLVCHNDLAPWNLVIGERWVFIDWDAAAPSTRLWDLAYAAQSFTLSDVSLDPSLSARNLAALVNGYEPEDSLRAALPGAMVERTSAMLHLLAQSAATGREPWASMHDSGHGEHWSKALAYVRDHQEVWSRALGR